MLIGATVAIFAVYLLVRFHRCGLSFTIRVNFTSLLPLLSDVSLLLRRCLCSHGQVVGYVERQVAFGQKPSLNSLGRDAADEPVSLHKFKCSCLSTKPQSFFNLGSAVK